MNRLLATLTATLVIGCGSSTPQSTSDMAVASSIADLAQVPGPDLTPAPAGFCGGVTCTGGTTCCVVGGTPSCTSSCPDGGLVAECQKPTDCAGATSACCITVNNYNPQSVKCSPGNQCVPAISAQGSGQDRACVTSTDCTDNGASGTMLPDCCTSKASGQHVCFSMSLLTSIPSLQQQFSCP
ncbi:MAG: hypothetical protein JWM53_1374 [bacterium]|nr:hypothetical protein [bacterium]